MVHCTMCCTRGRKRYRKQYSSKWQGIQLPAFWYFLFSFFLFRSILNILMVFLLYSICIKKKLFTEISQQETYWLEITMVTLHFPFFLIVLNNFPNRLFFVSFSFFVFIFLFSCLHFRFWYGAIERTRRRYYPNKSRTYQGVSIFLPPPPPSFSFFPFSDLLLNISGWLLSVQ